MPPISSEFINEHIDAFETTYSLLEDQLSKEVMTAFLNAKLGNIQGKNLLHLWDIKQYINDITLPFLSQSNPVSFIKMDVEGSELESLKGATKTIEQNMPLLAICVYHKPEDLITIPQYISRFNTPTMKYHFYLRHHCHTLTETVLYAVPQSKNI